MRCGLCVVPLPSKASRSFIPVCELGIDRVVVSWG